MTVTSTTSSLPPDASLLGLPDGLGHPSRGRGIRNQVATVAVYASFLLAVIPLAWILWTVVARGLKLVVHLSWWTHSQRGMTAIKTGGGAYHAILGTLVEALVCAAISVPIGILTAVYLVEYGRGRLARVVSFMVDILTGIPSIVAALFIYALWVSTLGFERVPIAV
jgi:phosphate transport system permease protein